MHIIIFVGVRNTRDTNYFIKFFTNHWCGEQLLVNKKVMLMVDLDENQL